MKAFVSDRYGSPDVMKLREVDKPELTEEGALVHLRATSVNAFDWHMLRGKPYLARLDEGFRTPKTTILGLDVAGIVEAVGANVTHIKPGDRGVRLADRRIRRVRLRSHAWCRCRPASRSSRPLPYPPQGRRRSSGFATRASSRRASAC